MSKFDFLIRQIIISMSGSLKSFVNGDIVIIPTIEENHWFYVRVFRDRYLLFTSSIYTDNIDNAVLEVRDGDIMYRPKRNSFLAATPSVLSPGRNSTRTAKSNIYILQA